MRAVANNIPGIYSSALAWQLLGRRWERVPRAAWSFFGVVICTVCAVAGRNSLYDIFSNFLSIMGYWVGMWVTIQALDELLFRRRGMPVAGYAWADWNSPEKLPLGLAALGAFLIGWAGAALSMHQVWWVGPIAERAYSDVSILQPRDWGDC